MVNVGDSHPWLRGHLLASAVCGDMLSIRWELVSYWWQSYKGFAVVLLSWSLHTMFLIFAGGDVAAGAAWHSLGNQHHGSCCYTAVVVAEVSPVFSVFWHDPTGRLPARTCSRASSAGQTNSGALCDRYPIEECSSHSVVFGIRKKINFGGWCKSMREDQKGPCTNVYINTSGG